MTWELAASGRISAVSVSAGRHLLAAGGLPARDLGGLLLLALTTAAVYLIGCRIWPYGRCLACLGSRRNWGSSKRRHGRCKVCRGTGERLRIGTRLMRVWSGGRWPR